MSSIPYDVSAVTAGTVNPANQNNVIPLNLAAGVNPGTAPAYMRSSLTPQQQAQISVSPDATLMYQYVSPPLSSSSSPYATTSRDRITQLPAPVTAVDYAAAIGQLSYYCRKFDFSCLHIRFSRFDLDTYVRPFACFISIFIALHRLATQTGYCFPHHWS